jgi:hypothetical protein
MSVTNEFMFFQIIRHIAPRLTHAQQSQVLSAFRECQVEPKYTEQAKKLRAIATHVDVWDDEEIAQKIRDVASEIEQ